MRKTRFMTMLFLVWSIAFFFVPEFRQGLQTPILALSISVGSPDLLRNAGTLPLKTLEDFARTAEQQGDPQTLAFVALRHPSPQEAARLAERAIALDPQLTWIYYSLLVSDRTNPSAEQWISHLEAWDPENAIPHLVRGEQIGVRAGDRWPKPHRLDEFAKETAWREALAAPRYDSYGARRFELERSWLRRHSLAKPPIVLWSVANYPIPNLLNVRTYGNLLEKKLAKEAEQAGRTQEALGYCWTLAHLGERMQLYSVTLLEKAIGSGLQIQAYERLLPLLRQAGRAEEAATVEYALRALGQRRDIFSGKDPLAQSSNYDWAALLVHLLAGLVVAFGLLTIVCTVYVNAKRWVRPEKKGRLYNLLTVAENYMPILLFLACLGLYSSYYPFARNFQHYLTATGEIHDFEALFTNVIPAFGILPGNIELGVGNPFRPYAWYALVGFVVVVLAAIPWRRGAHPKGVSIEEQGGREG
jgi:hypothetical protein